MTVFLDETRIIRRILVDKRLHARSIAMTIRAILVAGKVMGGKGSGRRPRHLGFNTQRVLTHDNVKETHVTPILAPGETVDNSIVDEIIVKWFTSARPFKQPARQRTPIPTIITYQELRTIQYCSPVAGSTSHPTILTTWFTIMFQNFVS